jgi:hypothetical protein
MNKMQGSRIKRERQGPGLGRSRINQTNPTQRGAWMNVTCEQTPIDAKESELKL